MKCRPLSFVALFLALPAFVPASTVLYLNSTQSSVTAEGDDVPARNLRLTRGSGLTSFIKDTQAGPVTPPTSGTQWTVNVASDEKVSFVSDQVSVRTVLSGNATINAWAKDNSTAANIALTAEILHLDSTGAYIETYVTVLLNRPELGQSASNQNWAKLITGSALEIGDRIGVRFHVSDASGVVMAQGYTATLYFGTQNPGTTGDSFVSFAQTIPFSTYTPTITPTPANTFTPTLSFTPSHTPTLSYTLSPTRTLTFTPSSFTATLSPTMVSSLFNAVSNTAPQTVTTPLAGNVLELVSWSWERGTSSIGGNLELYGCGPSNIQTPGVPLDIISSGSTNRSNLGGGPGYPTLGLGQGICFREPTPSAPTTVGGAINPQLVVRYRNLFIGTATPTVTQTFTVTPTFTITPTFTPTP